MILIIIVNKIVIIIGYHNYKIYLFSMN